MSTAPTSTAKANLGNLAAEIHIAIADNLDGTSLLHLRLVCRALAKDTTDVFAKRSFSVMKCDNTRLQSLLRLQNVCQVPYFSKHIKTVCARRDPRYYGVSSPEQLEEASNVLVHCFRLLAEVDAGKALEIQGCDTARETDAVSRALLISGHKLDDMAFNLARWNSGQVPFRALESREISGLRDLWSELKSLTVSWDAKPTVFCSQGYATFRRLLENTAQLERFELVGYRAYRVPALPPVQMHLRTGTLRVLRLAKFETTSAELLRCILHFRKTLKDLKLSTLTINETDEKAWPNLFEQLCDELSLTRFEAEFLVRDGLADPTFYDFSLSSSVTYSGSVQEVRTRLRELAETGVEWVDTDNESNRSY
ncbi:hypothetical protein Slin14017_G052650 [Septoria linicola]|nr:hypothetical protein Slin14017_G052650 [Septoria linicola]